MILLLKKMWNVIVTLFPTIHYYLIASSAQASHCQNHSFVVHETAAEKDEFRLYHHVGVTNFHWNPPQINAAILYLITKRRSDELCRSLGLLIQNFVGQTQDYPIVLFHEKKDHFDLEVIIYKVALAQSLWTVEKLRVMIRLYAVEFQFPKGFDPDAALKQGVVFQQVFPGYQHMVSLFVKS
jgi:hypothetical protein